MNGAELLSFPPPYRAGLAISNDVDDLWEPEGWWEFLRYLNTDQATRFGKGLALEVGDSFWFWTDDAAEQPGAYFDGLVRKPSKFAPSIGALGRAGYLDTLHSYGNFSRYGGFCREHAEVAAGTLRDEGFAPTVWINHGGGHDFQNLWSGCGDVPENPEAKGASAPEYHLDLTWKLGFRYAWMGELTLIPGQERRLGLGDWLGPDSPLRREAVAHVGRRLSRRLGYRQVLDRYPNYPTLENRLLGYRRLRDGTRVRTFVRFGDFERATFDDLAWLLRRDFLDHLERSGGYSVVFVHWCRHPGRSFENLSRGSLDALESLARRFREKRIWVTTTGRLLAYCEARTAIRVRTNTEGNRVRVSLTADPLPDGRRLERGDLAGISFRISDPPPNRVSLERRAPRRGTGAG
jgi:hypothetical protein